LCALAAWCAPALAVLSCGISINSVNGVYSSSSNLDLTGSMTVTCTRTDLANDPTTIYVGVNTGIYSASREMQRQTGTQLLDYEVYRNATPSGIWNEGTGRAAGATQQGGLEFTIGGASSSTTVPYYIRVPSGSTQPAGVYDDTLTATVRADSKNGAVLTTGTFNATASIIAECRFLSTPATVTLSYTSFAGAAASASSPFNMICTQSTPFTLSVSPAGGTLLGLSYTVAPNTASSTGTGFSQTFSVVGDVAANQAGTCTAATCSATSTPHTLTITY
jgi:spore coat protein U-like protein